MRCAELLAAFENAGDEVDRSGQSGRLVEVYPGAAIRLWGISSEGYKSSNPDRARTGRANAVAHLGRHLPLLRIDSGASELMLRSDDAIDAVIAALVARAHAAGSTFPTPEVSQLRAKSEGWIALPSSPLDSLCD
jgi:hypothetical protein